jgi:hypothetical protein
MRSCSFKHNAIRWSQTTVVVWPQMKNAKAAAAMIADLLDHYYDVYEKTYATPYCTR